jgi:hypothetical protein
MKVIEILNLNKELLKNFRQAGIRIEDVEYIELYKEYQSLYNKGEKTTYIVSVLADKYDISERTVYDIIRRFKSDCNLLAV